MMLTSAEASFILYVKYTPPAFGTIFLESSLEVKDHGYTSSRDFLNIIKELQDLNHIPNLLGMIEFINNID